MSSSDEDTAVRGAVPFELHASATCPPPAHLAASLQYELAELDADRFERHLTTLGAAAQPDLEDDPRAQLEALGEAVANCVLIARPDGDALIGHVLDRGHGHPLAVAILLQEIGRRARLPVHVVGGERGHFIAHQRLTEPLVLDPRSGRLADANALGTLHWQCGHQVAASLLDVLQPRYERTGDLTRALHVARLRTSLPFEDTQLAEQRLRRVTARLN